MERSEQILAGSQVHAGLAADGRVDLGEQRSGHLDNGHAAHKGCREEAGHVGDDTSAEANDKARAIGTGFGHLLGERFHFGEALAAFAAREEERRGVESAEGSGRAMKVPHIACSDNENLAGLRGNPLLDSIENATLDDGVVLTPGRGYGVAGHQTIVGVMSWWGRLRSVPPQIPWVIRGMRALPWTGAQQERHPCWRYTGTNEISDPGRYHHRLVRGSLRASQYCS